VIIGSLFAILFILYILSENQRPGILLRSIYACGIFMT